MLQNGFRLLLGLWLALPAVPGRAQTQPWPTLAQVDTALARSRAYFQALYAEPNDSLPPDFLVIFFDAFQAQYGYTFRRPSTALCRQRGWAPTNLYIKLYDQPYGHTADALAAPYTSLAQQFGATVDQMDTRTQWAMMCDSLPLPPYFVDTLRYYAAQGGYELTHAGLQLAAALRNGCLTLANPSVQALYQQLTAQIAAEYQAPPCHYTDSLQCLDLQYECVAMLYYMQAPQAVTPGMIAQIIADQLPDGTWPARPDHLQIGHATMLSTWALLAYRAHRYP